MDRQLRNSCQHTRSILGQPSGDQVPQEHNQATDENALLRDWSQLGRRVMAQAWRRFTDDLADSQDNSATPVVPAPHPEGQP